MPQSPPAIRQVKLGPADAIMQRRADGTMTIRSPHELPPYPAKLTERLEHWAATVPDRTFLAERDARGGWRRLSYAETLDLVRRLGGALLARGLSAETPLMILSGNDIEHALLGLAALHVGITYAPISPAYSLISRDFVKLRHIVSLLTPGLVFASDGGQFAAAIAAAVPDEIEIVVTRNPPAGRQATLLDQLLAGAAGPEVRAAHAAVGPDTIAKFLFTSGSTGAPKGVINTQRMLCSNMAMATAHFAYLRDEPPVILDWSPWNHTAGGNHDFNLALYNGGTFYLDDGRPMPGAIEATVRNLREVSPNWYFNVPRGYDALVPYLRADAALRENFFRDLKLMWYAAASMPQHTWNALDELAVRTCGERILILTGLGSTETAPFALGAGKEMVGAGIVGVPAVGVELKLVPMEGKYEARVRGPLVTPGYWRQPELTAKAFDEEGFYKLGDALKFVDPDDVRKGFLFDGRVAEDFKLATGTWVAVGPLRAAVIDHCAPLAKDVAIAGIDRDEIGILIFPDEASCRALCPALAAAAPFADVLRQPAVRDEFAARLTALAAKSTGSSNRVTSAVLLAEPPSIDVGEMTDKGSINQRAVLTHRAALVDALYAEPPGEAVITIRRG
jgi:feruloyl-CoA synthase